MDLATVDKLLTTTRTVRKRPDCTRPVAPVSAGSAPHIDRYWRLWYTSGEVINYARL